MGNRLPLPPTEKRSKEIVMQFNIEEKHMQKLWQVFVDMDLDRNGFWTITECFRLVREQRISIVSPLLEALFLFADKGNDGTLSFDDFLVSFTCFCALSKEEMIQYLFMIIDMDRNGYVTKDELIQFFSYRPPGNDEAPVFPANNRHALDLFQKGKWKRLYFDEFAQLCDYYLYIPFPSFHLQNLMREALLGLRFWNTWDEERVKIYYMEGETRFMKKVKVLTSGEQITVHKPSRFSMKEILEYSRRKTKTTKGTEEEQEKERQKRAKRGGRLTVTEERDEMISRTPLMNIIRNPRCAYHVPYTASNDAPPPPPSKKERKPGEVDEEAEFLAPYLNLILGEESEEEGEESGSGNESD